MFREKIVLSHLDDGNNRVFQNVGELIPHYVLSHPEDCILHSHDSENSNLVGLLFPLVRWTSVFVFIGTNLFYYFISFMCLSISSPPIICH